PRPLAPPFPTRRSSDLDVPVLAAAARLADELAFDVFDAPANRLAVGHLRPADIGVDLELPLHPVDDDLEVQLAHPADDGLRGLGDRKSTRLNSSHEWIS